MSGETFEALLARNLRCVRTLVQTRIGGTGYAEDVLQDILLRAFARRDQLRVQAKFRTWLWSIALNEIRAFFRRDRGIVSLNELPNLDVHDPGMSPLSRLERMELRDWIRGCIAELSERDQAAIRLRDIEERSVTETAAVLQSSVSATKTAHCRARKRLAEVIRASARPSGRVPACPAA